MTPWMWFAVFVTAAIVMLAIFEAGLMYLYSNHERRLGPDRGAMVPRDGLAVGVVGPDFEAADLRTGQKVRLTAYGGQRILLAFMAPKCKACNVLISRLNRFARDRREAQVLVVSLDGADAAYARRFGERIVVVGDPTKQIEQAFEVGHTPMVFLLDEERKVANRTISNSLIDLEDTLDGLGHEQGKAAWVPEAVAEPTSPDGGMRSRT